MLLIQTPETDLEDLKRRHAHVSYAQLGEDLILSHYLKQDSGFYVDVGCHDPFRYSTTALLHLYRGWRGMNIDADPQAIDKFRKARPGDINLNFGVSDAAAELEFTIFRGSAHNSFDARMVKAASQRMRVEQRLKVRVRPLRDILDEYLPPGQTIDYMNIDCEGLDERVIAGNDWCRFSPRILSVEIHALNLVKAMDHAVVRTLLQAGYRLRSHCEVTSIFERAPT
jgi:FkbM family methyltransferase